MLYKLMRLTAVPAAALMTMAAGPIAAEEASEEAAAELARKLANPIASLISVPLQLNYDEGFGADDKGSQLRLNLQPVVPLSISDDWNLISRTILPLVEQEGFPSTGFREFGTGDTVQSLFFSPAKPTAGGWTWGAGPVLLLPTASDDLLGARKWGAGPTAVALKQSGAWTYGALANHIESFAGDSARNDISASFLQPFLTYITQSKTTFALNSEATYDWESSAWSVPLNLNVNQLLKVGDQIMQVGGGVRYWLESPATGPEGWALRLNLVFVFPR